MSFIFFMGKFLFKNFAVFSKTSTLPMIKKEDALFSKNE